MPPLRRPASASSRNTGSGASASRSSTSRRCVPTPWRATAVEPQSGRHAAGAPCDRSGGRSAAARRRRDAASATRRSCGTSRPARSRGNRRTETTRARDEHDRLLLALAHLLERAPRIGVQSVAQAAHVEQLHRRERGVVDALRQRQPRHAQPALGPRCRGPGEQHRTGQPCAPLGDVARVVARDRSPACRRRRAPRRGPRGRGRRAARTPRTADRRRSAPRRCAAAATRRSARRGRASSAGSRPGPRTAPRSAAQSAG